jgi:hypothetical protein
MSGTPSIRRRVPASVRGAQALLLIPLGVLQLTAATAFTITGAVVTPGDWFVAIWAIVMGAGGAVVAVRLSGRRATPRLALGLLGAQAAFSAVKLTAYGETGSLLFLGLTVLAAVLLLLPASRRHFTPAAGAALADSDATARPEGTVQQPVG